MKNKAVVEFCKETKYKVNCDIASNECTWNTFEDPTNEINKCTHRKEFSKNSKIVDYCSSGLSMEDCKRAS